MKTKNIKDKLIITFIVILFAALLYISDTPCLFLRLFKIPCPGCGMTRALISALKLDFRAAFSYHMMFWSVPVLYIAFLFDGRLFPYKYLNVIFYTLIVLGFALNYIL